MLVWLYDFLFTRRIWTIINVVQVYDDTRLDMKIGVRYYLQDQFGNVKRKEFI
jgi:hypothetical protein